MSRMHMWKKGQIQVEQVLEKYFGFTTFLKGQKEVIETILSGQSAAAIFPTGAGKSLCYQLPALQLEHMTLVVSPLLSLMKDQLDFLLEKGIPAARLDSTLDRDEYRRILERARNGELKILMISVERFKNERFRVHLERMKISLMVIDEAHCISEWGHNFRPEYLKLPVYQQEFGIRQVLLLTATATSSVLDDMISKFSLNPENVTVTGFYRRNLYLRVTPSPESEKDGLLLSRIRENPASPTIIYVTLQKTAERVAEMLVENGFDACHYHAGMKNEERELVQNDFMAGRLNCVVATIAFGMGIDKSNIRRIIHYDLPKSIENYSQEIGRAGRDEEDSLCELLANRDNLNVLENFVYGDTPEKKNLEKLLEIIGDCPGFLWEVKLSELSRVLDIRILPLKTALVYLDLDGIIRPKYVYYEDYSFKYLRDKSEIISHFQGERQKFVTTILEHSLTKKIWTSVSIGDVQRAYRTDRSRIIAALEYFDEKRWIELQTKQTVEVFDILNQAFDLFAVTDKLYSLFKHHEKYNIERIHEMVGFFESNACLSKNLARYFGEDLDFVTCGHCSFCSGEPASIQNTTELMNLGSLDFNDIAGEFVQLLGEDYSATSLTRFLCGIYTPLFARYKVKKLPGFGSLERYRFHEVKAWIQEQN